MNFKEKINYIYNKVSVCPVCKEKLYNEPFNNCKKCIQCKPLNTSWAYFYIESHLLDSEEYRNVLQIYSENLNLIITIGNNAFSFGENNKLIIINNCELSNLIDINSPIFLNEDKIKTMLLFL